MGQRLLTHVVLTKGLNVSRARGQAFAPNGKIGHEGLGHLGFLQRLLGHEASKLFLVDSLEGISLES